MLRRFQGLLGRPAQPPQPPPDPAQHAYPADVTDADFAARALSSGPLTLVDFWADWCQPCQVVSAHVEMLARSYGERLRVLALDVDENPRTAERYKVMGLPTLIFFRDGAEVERVVGAGPYESLRRLTDRLLAEGAAPEQAESPSLPPAP
jgi:thioredoxin